ncbi:MAG: glycerophosphodiester phosphodiesterase [Pirellulales bacterium]|jgi:glycerophosphoryl diester phosphodiesterase
MPTLKLTLLVSFILLLSQEITMAQSTVNSLLESESTLVIGHRGASSEAPENTLPAFRIAVQQKADLVELDYYHSQDGVPVVLHDKTLDRTTNSQVILGGKKLTIDAVSSSQLKKLDAGSWFDAKFKGAILPTLEQALHEIQKGSITLIEHKQGDAKTLIQLLKKLKLVDQVVVQSFNWDFLKNCRSESPSVILVALGSKTLDQKRIDSMKSIVSGFAWNHKDVSQPMIDLVHENNRTMWVYTVNDQKTAKHLTEIGIDGIITDKPGALRSWID